MELPKNVTQIGESDRNCKIYVEDYVISYIKQVNHIALSKEMAVALYGIRKTEGNVTYLFVYGAAKLDFLQKETRHLSQAQCQEVERNRKKYFSDIAFLGYSLLNGEMVEGIYVCEQEICRYIKGYAQFYEKNDCMLAYMLDTRAEEVSPEVVNSEKYEMVKQRQTERKTEYREERRTQQREEMPETTVVTPITQRGYRGMKMATVAVFGVLCLVAIGTLGEGQGAADLQIAANQVLNSLTEQKIPDAEEVLNQNVQSNTLIAEDKLTEALQQENASVSEESVQATITTETTVAPTVEAIPEAEPEETSEQIPELPTESTPEQTQESTPNPVQESTPVSTTATATESVPEATPEPVSYTIKEGDTLIGICINTYGSDARVSEVCFLNEISDPDDIKIGQKILLPY